MVAVERQPKTSERPMQIGDDLVLIEMLLVPPGAEVWGEVILGSFVLPQNPLNLHVSTRSGLMQTGVEVVSTGQELIEGFSQNGKATTRVRVRNHGRRAVGIRGGVGRPYVEGENLEGEPLDRLFENGVLIQGANTSWEKIVDGNRTKGVRLYLDVAHPKHIPEGRPIIFSGKTYSREEIDLNAIPTDPSVEQSFYFFETRAHMEIKKGIVGILQDFDSPRSHMPQSRLIYGGQTDWPIRVEGVGPTISAEMPTHVDMVFQKVA